MPRRPARKRFGQHFLEPSWVKKVLAAIAPHASDSFVEIGPGRGALTLPLAEACQHVRAYEIDRDLAADLSAAAPANVEVIEGNFLDAAPWTVRAGERWRAAGNLPYNVASPMLFKLRELYRGGLPLVDATLMIQREVADRLLAAPGGREYGALSVLIGLFASLERLLELPPGAFRPAPKVRSTLVRLRFHPATPQPADEKLFQTLVTAIFSRRRKMLQNALDAFPGSARLPPDSALESAGIDGRRRPETLTPAEMVALADVFGRAML